ncbi:hypothetical protein MRB53_039854 [Persea americana]|nr:hypothetical protein MRB53_039854 [Persea americana]
MLLFSGSGMRQRFIARLSNIIVLRRINAVLHISCAVGDERSWRDQQELYGCGNIAAEVVKASQQNDPLNKTNKILGTDQSQGRGQILSNINACVAVQTTIKSTLGPYGGDLLLVDENGKQTITNDGATVMKLLDIVHPAARILTDIARSQDAEVGDGTTSVVVLAGEILKEIKEHVEQGVSSQQ